MSREIKFRAWNNIDKKMLDVGVVNLYWKKVRASNYYELMQFTGLRDANGAEIWEGDILEDSYGKRDTATMDRFPVFWMAKEKFGFEGEDLEQSNEWVVIGNIYEHPHLLDEAK